MKNYFISPVAEQDIDEIASYIAIENLAAAEKFIDSAYYTMEMLADHPLIGHKRDDLTLETVRFYTFKWHYIIVYRPSSPLEIVRVLSGDRDIANLINNNP